MTRQPSPPARGVPDDAVVQTDTEPRGSEGKACARMDDLSAEAQSQRLPSMSKYSAI